MPASSVVATLPEFPPALAPVPAPVEAPAPPLPAAPPPAPDAAPGVVPALAPAAGAPLPPCESGDEPELLSPSSPQCAVQSNTQIPANHWARFMTNHPRCSVQPDVRATQRTGRSHPAADFFVGQERKRVEACSTECRSNQDGIT